LSRMKDGSRDFSFSGLKTAVHLELQKNPVRNEGDLARLAAKFQRTVMEELRWRVRECLEELRPKSLVMGGGVACNQALRQGLEAECRAVGALFRVPPPKYCSDNAAMIAGLGSHHLSRGRRAPLSATAQASPAGPQPFLIP
ncbi:MAG TPA: tRNA (adenosine(37)-N6)-threonylcarbamoyltransferase complex transferase subunit TsaD, partial [bacterium]|nr:tRNA (adenosine(37)-N6)-threonylcarbamoyltransferase complex transferase subunit TsaD [bacterium]